jgi:hypothetical protein
MQAMEIRDETKRDACWSSGAYEGTNLLPSAPFRRFGVGVAAAVNPNDRKDAELEPWSKRKKRECEGVLYRVWQNLMGLCDGK